MQVTTKQCGHVFQSQKTWFFITKNTKVYCIGNFCRVYLRIQKILLRYNLVNSIQFVPAQEQMTQNGGQRQFTPWSKTITETPHPINPLASQGHGQNKRASCLVSNVREITKQGILSFSSLSAVPVRVVLVSFLTVWCQMLHQVHTEHRTCVPHRQVTYKKTL